METIFHERQEGSLCAQHCLNVLLQGEYFTAVDLATLGQQIDDEERTRMAEGGVNREEYRRFISSPSDNMDDSGFFSVQVITAALRVWSLDLVPFNSRNDIAMNAQMNPTKQKAYICNYREHWFTIRKIGEQWFNLNSLLTGPELISDTYLMLFLTQLQSEGYSIFIVNGILPVCNADNVLANTRVTQTTKPRLLTEKTKMIKNGDNSDCQKNDDYSIAEEREFQRVIQMSIDSNAEAETRQLEAALALSMQLNQLQNPQNQNQQNLVPNYMTEEEMLDAAMRMSLDPS